MKSEFEKHADAVDTAVLFFQVVCAIVSHYICSCKSPIFFKHDRPDHAHCLNLGFDPVFEAAPMLIPLMFTSNWGKAG